jgi:hypothetical protein
MEKLLLSYVKGQFRMNNFIYQFDEKKNEILKGLRGISFEEVIEILENGNELDVIEHPNQSKYSHQKIYLINKNSYAYAVPFVKVEKVIFLKTIFKSRTYNKIYKKKGKI